MSGNIGLFVEELFSVGTTSAGRSGTAGSNCNGLKHGVVEAASSAGHHTMTQALNTFHTDHILGPACELPVMVESGGHGISNLSSTTRNLDNEAGHAVQTAINSDRGVQSRINPTPV